MSVPNSCLTAHSVYIPPIINSNDCAICPSISTHCSMHSAGMMAMLKICFSSLAGYSLLTLTLTHKHTHTNTHTCTHTHTHTYIHADTTVSQQCNVVHRSFWVISFKCVYCVVCMGVCVLYMCICIIWCIIL